MKMLVELAASSMMLNVIQKGILAACFSAATPQLALEATNGSEALVVQRDVLQRAGFVVVTGNSLQLTKMGHQALISNNIIDDAGSLTEDGQMFLDHIKDEKERPPVEEAVEVFKLDIIPSLSGDA